MRKRAHRQAELLRKKGYSYREISNQLSVSKSSCSLWLRNTKISKSGLRRLQLLSENGNKKSLKTIRTRIETRNKEIRKSVESDLSQIKTSIPIQKLLCAVLYWAEGYKGTSQVSFTNSDPKIISTYLTLLRNAFNIKENKLHAWLHLHEYHDIKKQKIFWSRITGINKEKIFIYKKPNTGNRKREDYPGCISVRYNDVRLAKEIKYLYSLFAAREIKE